MDKEEALWNLLEDIVTTLCYQPDIPEEHKIGLLNKLTEYNKSLFTSGGQDA